MRDDLVQQLDPAQVRELETHIRRHFEADGAPAMTYRNIARAVLASVADRPRGPLPHLLAHHEGRDPVKLTDNQDLVLAAIRRDGLPTIREIATTTGLSVSSARTAALSLVRAGYVQQAGIAASGGACFRVVSGER